MPDTETQHRFTKLSQGSSKISVNQFELLPELAGNPFLPRLFEMFDADQDGKLSLPEFNSAIDFFLRLQSIDDKEECTLSTSCSTSLHKAWTEHNWCAQMGD